MLQLILLFIQTVCINQKLPVTIAYFAALCTHVFKFPEEIGPGFLIDCDVVFTSITKSLFSNVSENSRSNFCWLLRIDGLSFE